jgi:p-cumate 2,3-dioxygenase subunit alpha
MSVNKSYSSQYLELDPEQGTFMVHRDAYRNPQVFQLEKEKVLYKSWIILAHESEIENRGDFITRTVIDKDLILNRDRKGNVNAFFNSCRHRGPAVCRDKSGNRKTFACPYHGWIYRDDGQLISTGSDAADATFPEGFCDGRVSLMAVPRLEVHAGFYFVNFDADSQSLESFLADAGDRLQLINDQSAAGMEVIRGCHEYEINSNYKLLCENSYDGYHLGPVHQSYVEYMMDVMKGQDLNYQGVARSFGNGHACFEIGIRAGRPVAQWIPSMGDEVRAEVEAKRDEVIGRLGEERGELVCNTHRNMVIFPNSIINDQQSVLVRSIIPLAYNRMLVRAWTLGPKDESERLREVRLLNMLSFLGPGGFATPDDVAMLESAQRGYEATNVEWNDFSKGFSADEKTSGGGVADVDNEMQMRAYWLEWDRMMTA